MTLIFGFDPSKFPNHDTRIADDPGEDDITEHKNRFVYPSECHTSVLTAIALLQDRVDDLIKTVKGNGKPGISQDIVNLGLSCAALNNRLTIQEARSANRFTNTISVVSLIVSSLVVIVELFRR